MREIIIATNANVEGETTAMFLARLLKKYPVKVTRLAYGISVGTDISTRTKSLCIAPCRGGGTM